jgi:hypothetical protein
MFQLLMRFEVWLEKLFLEGLDSMDDEGHSSI